MNKQKIISGVALVILAVAFVALLPHLLDIVMFFLLAGIIPGTTHSIGAGWMFIVSMGLFGFVVANLAARYTLRRANQSDRKTPTFADNLPWKRFRQI